MQRNREDKEIMNFCRGWVTKAAAQEPANRTENRGDGVEFLFLRDSW